ncbi:anti-sigma factor [Kitasatospora sp. NPDC048365]|uniref:anti-sigma factor n=1 Tax=Kitasatospora sp. NPDC048365 TaxID=3364050 RepID=UPI003716CCB3
MSEGRTEGGSRSRWAQLARRSEQPAPVAAPELRALPVRPVEPAVEEHLGDRLSAYLDGELGHDSRERVQAHLATCPDCLAEAESARAVKRALHGTGTPPPSSMLMARLLAVAALPDDSDGAQGPGPQPPHSVTDPHTGRDEPGPSTGVFGGSRLTGGSFGRGAGSTFGGGALGADTPIPGIDPRARRPFGEPFAGRRGQSALPRPLAAVAETPVLRTAPRGRRLVFAAAGAVSVAAVTLGSVGSLPAASGGAQRPTSVTPVGGVAPVNAQLSVDYRDYPSRGRFGPVEPGDPHGLLR